MFCNGLNDSSFEAWAPEEEIVNHTKSGLDSPMTVDSDVKKHLLVSKEDKENSYLLVKNFPEDISESEVWNLFQDSVSLEKVIILSKINNVYLKFTSMIEIQALIATNESVPMVYKGQKLKMCSVLKLPLDLNKASKVVLLTIYDEKIEITAQAIHQIFKESYHPLKIIIFKKKNYQSFMEFESFEEAYSFKEQFDNTNFKGFFFLKVQFTKKNGLNVTKNSPMEHDFTIDCSSKMRFQTIDFNFEENPKRFSIIQTPNVVPSLQNFDDFIDCSHIPLNSKDLNVDLTMDTSEDKADYFYLLKVSNLYPDVKHKILFNLFSLYGNIEKISLDSQTRKAVIFYPTEFEQMTAHHCLANLSLFGQQMTIEVTKITKKEQRSLNFPNVVSYKKTNDTKALTPLSKLRVINKPLNVLYVFNLSVNVSLDMIKVLFNAYSPVLNIYYSNESKNSALVFFQTVEEAAKVLCLFKNTNLVDKSLKINFANNNLLKGKDQYQKKNKFVSLQSFNDFSPVLNFDSLMMNNVLKSDFAHQPSLKLLKKPLANRI